MHIDQGSCDVCRKSHADSAVGERHYLNLGSNSQEDRAKRSEFLAHMSHELRTPLNSICGYAQLLDFVAGPGMQETHRLYLTNIVRSSAVLLEMVNDILDYAKIQSGLVTLALGAHSVEQIIEDVVNDMASMAMEYNISVRFMPNKVALPFVSVDQFRASQILRNLISNAIKYNKPNGSVEISCAVTDEDLVRISVRDTGPGIASELLTEIFEPYNRAGNQQAVEGAGLGLAICKDLAEIMHAKLGCRTSKLGSEFWIDLPPATAQTLSSQLGHDDLQCVEKLFGAKILYIGDSSANQGLMSEMIATLTGASMTSVSGAAEALDKISDVDLVIVDIVQPVSSAFDLLISIRQAGHETIPVVALSAAAMRQDYERGMEAGFSAYIAKPFMAADLLRTLADALPEKTSAKEDHASEPARAFSQGQPTILVIEDEPFVRSMIVENLEDSGHTVFEAHNGYAGLTALKRCVPDLMIIDFAMPGLNGVEVARKARSKLPDLPIIVISGNVDPAIIAEIAGRNTMVLGKPFSLSQLQGSVSRMLQAETQ